MVIPQSQHVPVLAEEVIHWLRPQAGHILADGTLGGGGHARLLAAAVGPTGKVIALDRDPAALLAARPQLADLRVTLMQANYADLPEVLSEIGVEWVDEVLLDLGLSSDQLADEQRGFSFNIDGPLDLRFNPAAGEPAWRLINRLSAEHLADLIYRYGEERHSRRIARAIVAQREQKRQQKEKQPEKEKYREKARMWTSAELAALICRAVPGAARRLRIHPATRTFQALRIAVNDELKWLQTGLERLPACLRPGGRMAVISFHSLEDRLVKTAFREDPRLTVLTKKPVRPGEDEVASNPRSRSARLRVAERTA